MPSQAPVTRLGAFSSILGPDANIDRHGHARTVPMQVLSLGISRTGTLSMREALGLLGYPSTYHFSQLFTNVKDADIWNELLRAKVHAHRPIARAEFDQVIGHCGAVTDVPCAVLWEELIAAYPDAKVVLVERDEDAWVRSIATILEGALSPLVKYGLIYTDPLWFGRPFTTGLLWIECFFGSRDLERAKQNARSAYRRHNAGIRAAVAADRLLVYELGSGWEPLCRFLDKPVPDVEFPHRNESAALKMAFEAVFARAIRRSLFNIASALALVALGIGAVWSMRG